MHVTELKSKWDDLGSWESILKISSKDKKGNNVKGDVYTIDTKNSLVHSTKGMIATIGLEDQE